jgi:hypothetical protein
VLRYIGMRRELDFRVHAGALFVTGCLLLASGATPPHASAKANTTARVVLCRTEFVPGNPPAIPTKIAVDGNPWSVRGLAAYTNYDTYLIAPAGMACKGEVAEDGGANLIVWHRGEPEPRARSREEGLTLSQESACVGCMYSLACPMFPSLADRIYPGFSQGVPCGAPPSREQILPQGPDLARFSDPPSVAGDGDPSGGPYTAEGAVGYARSKGAFRITCTLPAGERWICRVSLNDAIARYG